MPSTDVNTQEVYQQDLVISLLDQNGDFAQATIKSSQKAVAYAFTAPPYATDGFDRPYGSDVLLNYAIGLSTLLFFEDALVGFGELADQLQGFAEGTGASWVEPGGSGGTFA
jgi:hypothetical protein